MLVAAIQQVQRGLYRWPYIQGIRSQFAGYSLAKDTESNKLPQDIAATIMMTSWHLRAYLWEDYAEESTPEEAVEISSARNTRETIVTLEPHNRVPPTLMH